MTTFKEKKTELHKNLKETLIKGFLNYKLSAHNKNISRWKAQMRRFCDSSQHEGSPVLTDFVCLEQKGQLAPGKYDELEAMFQNVDIRAVDIIRNTSARFLEMQNERKETKATHRRYIVMKSSVGKSEITPEQIEALYYVMQRILQHSRASSSWESDLQQIAKDEATKESPQKPKREPKWRSIANREELRRTIFETGNAISKSSKMSSDAFLQIVSFIANFQKSTNLTLEAVRPDGLYARGYENVSQNAAPKEECQRAVTEFLTAVFSLLGYDTQKANVSTQMDYLNEEVFIKATRRRWTNHPKSRQTTAEDDPTVVKTVERNHYDVMVSYQWEAKEVTLKVKNFLERNKVGCWMDTDHVTGSTPKAVENAIEHSDIFLMFYSFKYFTSKNCRQEAEHAIKSEKKIIPIKVDRDYQPRGWLNAIVGTRRNYDFSGRYPFEQKAGKLLKEIRALLQNLPPKATASDETVASEDVKSKLNGESEDKGRLHLIKKFQSKVKPGVRQLTCEEDRVWVGNGDNVLVSINKAGKETDMVCLGGEQVKYHAVGEDGGVFIIYRNSLMRRIQRQLRPFISYFADGFSPVCVACSGLNGDVLLGLMNHEKERAQIARYSQTGREIYVVENDLEGRPVLEWPLHVTVKKNEDVCIGDAKKGVVVLEESGNYLFTYPMADPRGMCVDNEDNLLVCNGSDSIHVISPEGRLLRTCRVHRNGVSAIAVQNNDRLLVGYNRSSIVEVYLYEMSEINR